MKSTCISISKQTLVYRYQNKPIFVGFHESFMNGNPHYYSGLRIKETKEVYEGEVTELTVEETESAFGGYQKTSMLLILFIFCFRFMLVLIFIIIGFIILLISGLMIHSQSRCVGFENEQRNETVKARS